MKIITLKGHIHAKPAEDYEKDNVFEGFRFAFHPQKDMSYLGYSHVTEVEFDAAIPDAYDPRAEAVRLLEAQREKLRAEFQKHLTAIESQISRFQALEYVSEEASE